MLLGLLWVMTIPLLHFHAQAFLDFPPVLSSLVFGHRVFLSHEHIHVPKHVFTKMQNRYMSLVSGPFEHSVVL